MNKMGKGYRIVEPSELDPLFSNRKYFDIAVAIFHWLIAELYVELGDELQDVEIEVIKVVYHLAQNGYPALGVHYLNNDVINDTRIEDLVEVTANRLLKEKPLSEVIKFIATSDKNWKEVTAKLLNDES
jgi:hypothetical protein